MGRTSPPILNSIYLLKLSTLSPAASLVSHSNLASGQVAQILTLNPPDAAQNYYSAPQSLQGGKIVGHTHVTVQRIESFNPTSPPDPAAFEFFKGINDSGDGNGNLKATVIGLAAGFYRVCTLTSASNHQPVLMPIAQRGAQDDCQKFSVGQGKNGQSISISS